MSGMSSLIILISNAWSKLFDIIKYCLEWVPKAWNTFSNEIFEILSTVWNNIRDNFKFCLE